MRITTIEFEISVTASTGPGAPLSSTLPMGIDGYLIGAYFATNAPPNTIYWRLSTQNGRLLVPYMTGARVGSGVPSGWAVGLDKINHPLEVKVFDDTLRLDCINVSSTTAYYSYLQVLLSDEGPGLIGYKTMKDIEQIRDILEGFKT